MQITQPKVDHGHEEAQRHGIARSPQWPAVSRKFVKDHPTCAATGPNCLCSHGRTALQTHHRIPFHYCIALGRPDLELDDRNFIALCEHQKGAPAENHHLLIGHADAFVSSNLSVEEDATKTFLGMTADQIKADPVFAARVASRLKPLDEMTADEKTALRALMDSTFPLAT